MKKIYMILSGFLTLTPSLLLAQNTLIQENRIWEYSNSKGNAQWVEQFCFDGTQEHNGKTYHQWKLINTIRWNGDSQADVVVIPTDSVTALLREENGKVYMLMQGETVREYDSRTRILSRPFEAPAGEEAVLYDFNLSKDDSFRGVVKILWAEEGPDNIQTAISDCTVTETGTLELTNAGVEKFTLQADVNVALVKGIDKIAGSSDEEARTGEITLDGDGGDTTHIMAQSTVRYAEVVGNIGRGNMTSLIPSWAIFLTSGLMDYHSCVLTCVYDTDGTIIYGTPSGIFSPVLPVIEKDTAIYDLHGRKVTEILPGSVYIRAGKKFVTR